MKSSNVYRVYRFLLYLVTTLHRKQVFSLYVRIIVHSQDAKLDFIGLRWKTSSNHDVLCFFDPFFPTVSKIRFLEQNITIFIIFDRITINKTNIRENNKLLTGKQETSFLVLQMTQVCRTGIYNQFENKYKLSNDLYTFGLRLSTIEPSCLRRISRYVFYAYKLYISSDRWYTFKSHKKVNSKRNT